jgi:hypothetical protein
MLSCLVYLIIWIIVALIVLYIIETLLAQFLPLPPPVIMLIRLLFGLLVLIAVLNCIGIFPGGPGLLPFRR